MRKMAIFVEGKTEWIFMERLLGEVAGHKRLRIEMQEARGGGRCRRQYRRFRVLGANGNAECHVLLVNSSSDNRVKSDIREQYHRLATSGYRSIVGILDVYPRHPMTDIPRLRRGLRYRMPTVPVEVLFVLGVMEVETWFISEHTHFPRIHPELQVARIARELRYDPGRDDIQQRPHPSRDLDDAYKLVGLRYTKSLPRIKRTVRTLDYAEVYLHVGRRVPDLQALLDHVDAFLS